MIGNATKTVIAAAMAAIVASSPAFARDVQYQQGDGEIALATAAAAPARAMASTASALKYARFPFSGEVAKVQ